MTRRPPGPTFPPPHIDLRTEFEAAFERPYPGLCRESAIEWLTMLLQERDRLRGLVGELVRELMRIVQGRSDQFDHGVLERARRELGEEG